MKRVIDLFLHTVRLEDRRRTVVVPNAVPRAPGDLPHHVSHPIGRRAIVTNDFVDLFREKIAHRSFDQIRLFK